MQNNSISQEIRLQDRYLFKGDTFLESFSLKQVFKDYNFFIGTAYSALRTPGKLFQESCSVLEHFSQESPFCLVLFALAGFRNTLEYKVFQWTQNTYFQNLVGKTRSDKRILEGYFDLEIKNLKIQFDWLKQLYREIIAVFNLFKKNLFVQGCF